MGKAKTAGERKLVVLSGKTKGMAFVLTKPEVNAGRESDNAICLKGKRVSRYHAVLIRTNGEYTLRDVSPQIGTFLNGRKTKEKVLKVGDRIRIGEVEMRYEAASEVPVVPVVEAPVEPMMETPIEIPTAAAPVVETLVEIVPVPDPVAKHLQRIAELTQENERLIGEAKLANETLESLRAELKTVTEQRGDLMERLGVTSHDNAVLFKLNGDLQAEISGLETQVSEMNRQVGKMSQQISKMDLLEKDLAEAHAAIRKMDEDLVREREAAKAEAMKAAAIQEQARQATPVPVVEEVKKVEAASIKPVEAPAEAGKMIAAAILAKQDVFDPTNAQFDKIRRSIVEKKGLEKPKTLLDRFMLPFRDMRNS